MPENTKIIVVSRKGFDTIASPDMKLNDQDKLIIVAKTESISQVEEIFNF